VLARSHVPINQIYLQIQPSSLTVLSASVPTIDDSLHSCLSATHTISCNSDSFNFHIDFLQVGFADLITLQANLSATWRCARRRQRNALPPHGSAFPAEAIHHDREDDESYDTANRSYREHRSDALGASVDGDVGGGGATRVVMTVGASTDMIETSETPALVKKVVASSGVANAAESFLCMMVEVGSSSASTSKVMRTDAATIVTFTFDAEIPRSVAIDSAMSAFLTSS